MKRSGAATAARSIDYPRRRAGLARRSILLLAAAALLTAIGCATASAPLNETPKVVATPLQGQVEVSSQALATVGNVQPVFVSVANGTDTPMDVVPSQIFALNLSGERVAPLPPGEAAREAGNAGELSAALKSGVASGLVGGGIGAGLGAAAGAALGGGAGTGAVVGGAIGAGEAMLSGITRGMSKADREANQQINAVALKGGPVRRQFTVSGYVFFPKGDYSGFEILLVNSETGDTQAVKEPWH